MALTLSKSTHNVSKTRLLTPPVRQSNYAHRTLKQNYARNRFLNRPVRYLTAYLNPSCTPVSSSISVIRCGSCRYTALELVTSQANWQLIWRQVIKWPLIMLPARALMSATRSSVSSFCEETWLTDTPPSRPTQGEGQRADIEKTGVGIVQFTLLLGGATPRPYSELWALERARSVAHMSTRNLWNVCQIN
jgi:hypothetical protein